MCQNRNIVAVCVAVCALILAAACASPSSQDRELIYQVSTIGALMNGVYDGEIPMGTICDHGDIGLGTIEDLDGELIILDGIPYQIKLDGTTLQLPDSEKTPFAVVTCYDCDNSYVPDSSLSMEELQSYIDGKLTTDNIFQAIKITGKFKYMETRSVPGQSRPYPVLTEVIKEQQVREFEDVEGTIVGFRCPAYVEGVNVPGYHFHFLNAEKMLGGHVLDFQTDEVFIGIDDTTNFMMILPQNAGFYETELDQGEPEGLQEVEKGS